MTGSRYSGECSLGILPDARVATPKEKAGKSRPFRMRADATVYFVCFWISPLAASSSCLPLKPLPFISFTHSSSTRSEARRNAS